MNDVIGNATGPVHFRSGLSAGSDWGSARRSRWGGVGCPSVFVRILVASLILLSASAASAEAQVSQQSIEAGIELASRGAYDAAASTFGSVAEQAVLEGDVEEAARANLLLGEVLIALGQERPAREALESALELATRAGGIGVEVQVLSAQAEMERRGGAFAPARKRLDRALDRVKGSGDQALMLRTLANAARAEWQMGGTDRAEKWVRAAEQLLVDGSVSAEEAIDQVHLADTLGELSRKQGREQTARGDQRLRAFALYQRVMSQAGAVDPRVLVSAQLGTARLYEDEGRLVEASEATARAALSAQTLGAEDLLQPIEQQLGRLAAARGDWAEARKAYERSLVLLSRIRPQIQTGYEDPSLSFRTGRGETYYALVDLLLREEDNPPGPAGETTARRRRAREIIEALKADELRDYFGNACVELASDARRSIDDPSLSRALVVYPIVLADRIEILVSLRERLERFSVAVPREEVERVARLFRRQLEDAPSRAYLRSAMTLYDWLVRPYAELLGESVDTIVFVPDAPLRGVPMAALYDGKRFLVEDRATAIAPGLWLSDPRAIDLAQLEVLAVGVSESVEGFPALPHVREELAGVKERLGASVLLDDAFTPESWRQAIASKGWGVLHVATHAEFRAKSEESFLLTRDGRIEMQDFERLIREFESRAQPLELLTLSACETAAGSDRAALGLAGVAVQSGARSVLGSLWTVNDVAASRLIHTFYDQLKQPGVSRSEALRSAQQRLLTDDVLRHPAYWSAFVLINNWM